MKFSVLIPVYNVEKYLEACLNSVLGQTFRDFEVVAVNDGSTDGSAEILSAFAQKDSRIRIVLKENGGLFHARLTALTEARGEYVVHLDSDDAWEPQLLEVCADALERENPDLLIFNYKKTYPDGSEVAHPRKKEECGVFEGERLREFYRRFIGTTDYNSIWTKVYKRAEVSAELFGYPRIGMSEDVVFSLDLFKRSEKIVVLDDALIRYRQVPTSMVRTYRSSDRINLFVYDRMREFAYARGIDDEETADAIRRRALKDLSVTLLLAPNSIRGKRDVYREDVRETARDPRYRALYEESAENCSFVVRYINRLIYKERIRTLIFYKRILQIKWVNRLLRKVYGA